MDKVKICLAQYEKENEFFALKYILKKAHGHFWGWIYIAHINLPAFSSQLSEISCRSSQEIHGNQWSFKELFIEQLEVWHYKLYRLEDIQRCFKHIAR